MAEKTDWCHIIKTLKCKTVFELILTGNKKLLKVSKNCLLKKNNGYKKYTRWTAKQRQKIQGDYFKRQNDNLGEIRSTRKIMMTKERE